MMGQQQTVVPGSALRRMILVLAVAALMAALVAVSAAPAFAQTKGECTSDKAKQFLGRDTHETIERQCGVGPAEPPSAKDDKGGCVRDLVAENFVGQDTHDIIGTQCGV